MKTGVIDVGGGLRGIYATGIFDRCLEEGITFDLCIGVSAGSANLITFLSGQHGRNFRFYTEYAQRPEYMGLRTFLRKRSFVDLDYVYSTLSNSDGEDPLDYDAFEKNPAEFLVVAANAKTGEVKYFDRSDIHRDCYDVMKASSAIPVVCRPYPIGGALYFDGALCDPVPVKKAFDCGCDRVVLILTRPEAPLRKSEKDLRLAAILQKSYPNAAECLRQRAQRYNDGVALARAYAAKGRAVILAPDDIGGLDTLTRDRDALCRLYEKGKADFEKLARFMAS